MFSAQMSYTRGSEAGRSPICIDEEKCCDSIEDCPISEHLQVGTGPSAGEASTFPSSI